MLYRTTKYLITDKRVIKRFGVFFCDFKIADFDNIRNVDVKISFTDKLAGNDTGSIIISTSTTADVIFRHIKNCYEVVKMLKTISYDIKTDINFPNAYRPEKNAGYKTEYEIKK